jgi:hypothetical protein
MQQEHPNLPTQHAQRRPLTMEQLHAMLTELHGQLRSTRNDLQTMKNELNSARTQLASTQAELHRSLNTPLSTPKRNNPQHSILPLKSSTISRHSFSVVLYRTSAPFNFRLPNAIGRHVPGSSSCIRVTPAHSCWHPPRVSCWIRV